MKASAVFSSGATAPGQRPLGGPSAGLGAVARLLQAGSTDRSFMALLGAYRGVGGLLGLKELLQTRRGLWPDAALQALPTQVASRAVLGLAWDERLWLPACQFDAAGAVRPGAAAVYRELVPVFDAWELAAWFVGPSCWLHGQRPVDLLGGADARLLEAARVDRYVATGG